MSYEFCYRNESILSFICLLSIFIICNTCTKSKTMEKTYDIPCSIDINCFKAYIDPEVYKNAFPPNAINAFDFDWFKNQPKSLRILALDKIVEHWHENPIFEELTQQDDKNYILDHLDLNIPIKILSAHIKDDFFWKKCFMNRWKNCVILSYNKHDKNWINIYMEKYLSEILEKLDPYDYEQENIQSILDICSSYITSLDIDHLQPSMGERTDHIPFDFILSNLPELKKFRISYEAKTIGTEFYLGCSSPSKQDMIYLGQGLEKCYELNEFHIHSTKIESETMKNLGKCLDKGCSNLEILAFPHCRIGDAGLMNFINTLNKESFSNLRELHLSNNLLSQEAALWLSRSIKNRQIELLDVSLNPIGSDGAAAIFAVIGKLPIELLDVSACSIDKNIERMLLRLLIESRTLIDIDFSDNHLGLEVGKNIYKIIGFNKILRRLDLRNTEIPTYIKNKIKDVIFENRVKF